MLDPEVTAHIAAAPWGNFATLVVAIGLVDVVLWHREILEALRPGFELLKSRIQLWKAEWENSSFSVLPLGLILQEPAIRYASQTAKPMRDGPWLATGNPIGIAVGVFVGGFLALLALITLGVWMFPRPVVEARHLD